MANRLSGVLLHTTALAIGITLITLEVGPAEASKVCRVSNCLGAHDINGIALDLSIEQVSELFGGTLTRISDDQFKGEKDGVSYDMGFSVLGYLFRIDSSQELGRFEPDEAFGKELTRKLTAKYGPPEYNSLPDGTASWDYVIPDPKPNPFSNSLSLSTESLGVRLGTSYEGPTTLHLKLMDFRIMRRDQARQNEGPSVDASKKVHF